MTSCEGTPAYEQKMIDENGVWECQYILYSKTECVVGDWTTEYKQTHEYLPYVFIPSHINGVKVVQFGYSAFTLFHYYNGGGKIFFPYTMKKIMPSVSGRNIMIVTEYVEMVVNNTFYIPAVYS